MRITVSVERALKASVKLEKQPKYTEVETPVSFAMEENNHLWILEAKVEPNDWQSVDQAFSGLRPLVASFDSEAKAKSAKTKLKSYLSSTAERKLLKLPIRIRRIEAPADVPPLRED